MLNAENPQPWLRILGISAFETSVVDAAPISEYPVAERIWAPIAHFGSGEKHGTKRRVVIVSVATVT